MNKVVNLEVNNPIRNLDKCISRGTYHNITLSTNEIFKCICSRALVDEVLPNGKLLRLNLRNYDKDNSHLGPVIKVDLAETPKVEEPKVEVETKPENPQVEEPKVEVETKVEESEVEAPTEETPVVEEVKAPTNQQQYKSKIQRREERKAREAAARKEAEELAKKQAEEAAAEEEVVEPVEEEKEEAVVEPATEVEEATENTVSE